MGSGDDESVAPAGEQRGAVHALSFDVEDWYHSLDPNSARWDHYEDRVAASTRHVLRTLARHRTRATFFVLGHVAQRHPDLVREIHAGGHEVASHSMRHEFIYRQTPAEFERDLTESLTLLAEITGQSVRGYRAPYFSITRSSLWALPILADAGLHYDSSIHPVLNHRYGIPQAPRRPHEIASGLMEIPVTTFPLRVTNVPCGGGVYFRIFPYWLSRRLFRRLAARGERIVFYLHPWECDPGQPVLPVAPALRWRHYVGLEHTTCKLERLLTEFEFRPFREVFSRQPAG